MLSVVLAGLLFTGAAAAAELPDLRWLAGCWSGPDPGAETTECWMDERGGMMLGVGRIVGRDGTVSFEYLRIVAEPDGVSYVASPRGGTTTTFRLVEAAERRIVFENPTHDFPRRIAYELLEDGTLHARIEGIDRGTIKAREWTWRRVDFPGGGRRRR